MGDFDKAAFTAKIAEMFDDQIIALLSINSAHYSPEAVELGRIEADKRGILGDVQHVKFDILLNSAGFAGRLILLEEQLMFLSTGLAASSGATGIPGELYRAQRSVASAQMDFSALDTDGSWIYFLDQIKDCTAASKFLSGPELQFVIEEENGDILNGVVNCGDFSKSAAEDLADLIRKTRDEYLQKQG